MPQPENLRKAELQKICWDRSGQASKVGAAVPVQFNPETLKLARSNQISGGNQSGGAAIQFSGRGTTKLSFDLWFDVTAPAPDSPAETDVRKLTARVAEFMKTEPKKGAKGKTVHQPPGIRFLWGSFLFEGVMESMNETLELFSADGRPLRASVSVGLVKQDVKVQFGPPPPAGGVGAAAPPGTEPLERAEQGDTVQDIAARRGEAGNWQRIAAANGIENPRHLLAGTPIDLGGAGSAALRGDVSAALRGDLSAALRGDLSWR